MIQYYTAESRFLYQIWNFPFIRLHWLAKKTQEKKKERKNIYALISIKHKNPDNKNIKKKKTKIEYASLFSISVPWIHKQPKNPRKRESMRVHK